jgi:U3 small nucleolar RNA-associated protein 15
VIQGKRTKTLQQYDKLLRAFRYGDALDAVIHLKNPIVVASMLDELVHRDGIRIAMANRDEDTLEPLLQFVIKHISNPKYATKLIDIGNIVLGNPILIRFIFTGDGQ